MRAHDLLQISGLADLVYVGWELLPPSPKPVDSPSREWAIGYTSGSISPTEAYHNQKFQGRSNER